MAYCVKCGKPNNSASKFCTGCGATLTGIPEVNVSATGPLIKEKKNRKITNWIIGSLAVLLTAAVAYFIFFYREKTTENRIVENSGKTNTTSSRTPEVKVSDPAPLKPEEPEITLSQAEIDIISRRINEFYEYETKEDIPNLFSYYHFPLDRYYDLYNVSYDKLHKMVTEAYNGKLYYHNIKINWNYSTVQKISTGGYKVLLSAIYTSASQSYEDKKSKYIHLVILMNNNYEITSIYSD